MGKNLLWSQAERNVNERETSISSFTIWVMLGKSLPVPQLPGCSERLAQDTAVSECSAEYVAHRRGSDMWCFPPLPLAGEWGEMPTAIIPVSSTNVYDNPQPLLPENSLPLSTPDSGSIPNPVSNGPCNLGQVPFSPGLSLPFCKTREG